MSHRPPREDRPRCGAKTRVGRPCVAPALWLPGASAPRNGRCRMHGGLSTGPRTPEGRQRCLEAPRRAREARRDAREREAYAAHAAALVHRDREVAEEAARAAAQTVEAFRAQGELELQRERDRQQARQQRERANFNPWEHMRRWRRS